MVGQGHHPVGKGQRLSRRNRHQLGQGEEDGEGSHAIGGNRSVVGSEKPVCAVTYPATPACAAVR